jgi:hypothetical protein
VKNPTQLTVGWPRAVAFPESKQTRNLREQAVRQVTLVDEAIGAVAATFVGKRKAIEFREDDHPQVWAGEADLLCSLQPVDPRHAEIEKDQIRLVNGCKLYSIQAVTGCPYDLKPSGEF